MLLVCLLKMKFSYEEDGVIMCSGRLKGFCYDFCLIFLNCFFFNDRGKKFNFWMKNGGIMKLFFKFVEFIINCLLRGLLLLML